MLSVVNDVLKALVQHPSVGALGFVFAVCATAVGYTWGQATFASKGDLSTLKTEIVTAISSEVTNRDIRAAERQIERLNTRINLNRCATESCDIEKAERTNLERYVDALREELK